MTEYAKRILIGEDERPMASALVRQKLSKTGFEATAVSNGQEVLDELEHNQYDLLLLDLMMPKMDGFAVLEALREKKLDMPIIVSTNLGQEEDEAKARALGAKDYFVKSNTPIIEVVDHIKSVLGLV